MEFGRPPTRRAPRVPSPSVPSYPCVVGRPASPSQSFEANHEALADPLRAESCSTWPNLHAARAAEVVIHQELQNQQEALDRREAALQCSEQLLEERVAAWEARCRLWEAQYAERLAELDAREARLGRSST
ncbi:hypothetical protein JIQ42_04059 [Leishmania sp. Namibia]|uniref:hypothetical protein n=1 Tax=Leishmania sp. Namibia TaxID=2802991 RepID=UPI001B4FD420|nr:hypothetical protein JIQ42_04059 [Leishmania sp. Namibia]